VIDAADQFNRRLRVDLTTTPWPEGIAPAMFEYSALLILNLD
jgi:hypothetical protein